MPEDMKTKIAALVKALVNYTEGPHEPTSGERPPTTTVPVPPARYTPTPPVTGR